jgi:osmotically inducible protein OsmC
MAFSNTLAKNDTPPTRLITTATCVFEVGSGGAKISSMTLAVRGQVVGLDQSQFEELAGEAEAGCPVSNALRNNVSISVNAHLDT